MAAASLGAYPRWTENRRLHGCHPIRDAHNAGPCNESGGPGHSDYATRHIVAAAHAGALGDGGHKPGFIPRGLLRAVVAPR